MDRCHFSILVTGLGAYRMVRCHIPPEQFGPNSRCASHIHSFVQRLYGRTCCLSGQISSIFWHRFPEFRPRARIPSDQPTKRAELPNLRPQSGRDRSRRVTRRRHAPRICLAKSIVPFFTDCYIFSFSTSLCSVYMSLRIYI